MKVIYKTLFEIKLLHEYLLTSQDGKSIFDPADQAGRLKYLLERFALNKESVNAHVSFEFPESSKLLFESSFLKLVPSYSGCKVAIKVQRNTLQDGSVVFKPQVEIGDNMDIFILIRKKTGLIDSYTSRNLHNPLPAIYFFSNDNGITAKTHPYLTGNIPGNNLLQPYEQGELVSFGPGDTREYYSDSSGPQWIKVKATSLANETDRLLLPTQFNYTFPPGSNSSEASWTLKDGSGNTIKTITLNQSNPIQKAELDFSDKKHLISFSQQVSNSSPVFALEVIGSNGYSRSHRILFNDRLYDRSHWAVIHMKIDPPQAAFRLLDNDGLLIKRATPAGDIDHPVFEIPVKSRSAYWRFINDRNKELKLITDLEDYLLKEEKILITKRPRPVSRDYFNLTKDGSNAKKYVPNPSSYMLTRDAKDRVCFDIRIPESALFPIMGP
jgi:hypothetical protein